MKRGLYMLALTAILFFSLANAALASSSEKITFQVGKNSYWADGRTVPMDAATFMENNRVYVPVRYLALSLGVDDDKIYWSPSEMTVTLEKGNIAVVMSVGKNLILVNGRAEEMDVAPVLKSGRVYLPARYLAEALGYKVGWDGGSRTVGIDLRETEQAAGRPSVNGSPVFRGKINGALDLLMEKAPLSWEIVAGNLLAISEHDRSGADVAGRVFNVGPATAASDIIWLASVIVHDAYHVQQYREGRIFHGEEAEAEAVAKQRRALVELGAPSNLIEYLDNSLSTKFWDVEYQNRNW